MGLVTGAVSALQGALAAEHAACYGYAAAGAHLTGAALATAEQYWTGHNQARDTLASMISRLGGTPVAAQAFYRLPFRVHDAATAMALAASIEDGVTRAYLGVVAVADERLRNFGALAMQGSAGRATFWRGSTQAFPGLVTQPSLRCSEARTRTIVAAAWSTSSATAIRSAQDHQNHQIPSLPQPAYTFSSSALAAGFTTYRLGLRPGGAISQASSPRWDSSSASFSR
jgi:hypothetical protein